METEDQDQRETETGDGTGQRALLACGMPEDTKKKQRPPKQQHTLNARSHQGR